MLYMIGLGLSDAKDITVNGLEIVKRANQVYLETYTSILACGQKGLEEFYGRPVIPVDREMMEQGCKQILEDAEKGDTAVLVVGDPLNATTHSDLIIRATNRNIKYKIIHNASIVSAVACCGLQIYRYGEIVSIPFWTETWKPESFYDKIVHNKSKGLHTLCLLDIRVKEPNYNLLINRGISQMEPPRFMTVAQAAEQLVYITVQRKKKSLETCSGMALDDNDICIGLVRVGTSSEQIVRTTLSEATNLDLGPPLHSLVIPATLHPVEEEFLSIFPQVY